MSSSIYVLLMYLALLLLVLFLHESSFKLELVAVAVAAGPIAGRGHASSLFSLLSVCSALV
jgi:hypothetical protein